MAKGFVDDPKKAINSLKEKTEESSRDGDFIVNVTDNIKNLGQFGDLAKATTSVVNNITSNIDNAKNLTPDKIVTSLFRNIWKEDDKFLGFTITRGQKIYVSLSFIIGAVLFLGMDLSLLFISHEFESVKYSIFFSIWALSFLLGIILLDSAIPERIFEKKTKTTRTVAISIYVVTLISSVVIANVYDDSWSISFAAFIVHFISMAWLTTTHMPTFKGLDFSFFSEKSPLLFSNFYNSVEQ